jgi:hypothetical protein
MVCIISITAIVYWPALKGGFLFDDFPNIVDNVNVHVSSLSIREWYRAALASPASQLKRPLSMLSFAANEYFTGNNPFPMKLTNLFIHIFNGIALFLVLLELFELYKLKRPEKPLPSERVTYTSAAITAAWLIAPINLTGVMYVVQRMESLAQSFVLLGLWGYCVSRRHQISKGNGRIRTLSIVYGCTTLGLMCKETAALLPVYAVLIELTVLGFAANTPSVAKQLKLSYLVFFGLPLAIGLITVAPHQLSAAAYAERSFTLGQRLLTELRVVASYIGWTLVPLPNQLSFYHDDITLSSSLLDPPETLICMLLLGSLLILAWLQRKRRPLLSLGLLWFFAAHSLTGTIIPLELVFEHRNYFSSIGLFLALAAVILDLPESVKLVRWAVPLSGLLLFSLTTGIRAQEWSNPLRFAYAEVAQHPYSPRANYELGRLLVILSGYNPDSPFVPAAVRALEAAAALPQSSTLPEAALLLLANHIHTPINEKWWRDIEYKLTRKPPTAEDVSALQSLVRCQSTGECAADTQPLLGAFLAALNHPSPPTRLLMIYSDFSSTLLHDDSLSEEIVREAISKSPGNIEYKIQLANVLLSEKKLREAHDILAELRSLHLDSSQIRKTDILERVLATGLQSPAVNSIQDKPN